MHGIDRELRELFEMGECRHDRAPVGRMLDGTPPVQPEPLVKESRTLVKDLVKDAISRQAAIDAVNSHFGFSVEEEYGSAVQEVLNALPSAQPEEVIPHRNYKYLSDYWCECGWHLGKKGEVKYCADCGRKVNWDG